jgi:hypothetical protein
MFAETIAEVGVSTNVIDGALYLKHNAELRRGKLASMDDRGKRDWTTARR